MNCAIYAGNKIARLNADVDWKEKKKPDIYAMICQQYSLESQILMNEN